MIKLLAALVLLPNLAFASAGSFNANLGTYRILARHAKEARTLPAPTSKAFYKIEERIKNGHRAITYFYQLDDVGNIGGGGPLLTSAEITGNKSLNCIESENIISCTMATGWFITAVSHLADGKVIVSEYNAGERVPEVIWELEKM